jgi:hypothetical protein
MSETLSDNDRLAIRRRLLEDFEFYAKHAVKIRTKQGTIVPLVLNAVQLRFVGRIIAQMTTRGYARFVVLKARQQGLSTVISALQYWWLSQHKAQKGLVMAHEADSTTALFDMYKRIHDNVPAWVRPSTKYSSRTELVFDKLDSGLRVATAGGRGVARGETLTTAHLSEVAFWPVTFAAANFNGLIQAVPEERGTMVFVESTAQGVTGKFYDLWQNAVGMGYEQFFSAWFESAEYRDDTVPADFQRTPDEDDIAALYSLDNAQLFWRRKKISANGRDLFRQEYPSTPEEAFISTGRPVFNPDYILERMQALPPVIATKAVDNGVLNDNPRGELLVYRTLDPAETYTIGADVGMGVRNGDRSVAQVLDSQKRQVAVWRGLVHPDYFAQVLIALGYFYNTALIGPERNNHGLLTCVRLRDLGYPNIYTDTTEGTLEDKDTINIGFFTSERTKPLIIDKLRAAEREREIEINDHETLKEMFTFVVTESGKMEAEGDAHDDCVMALAIANHIHEGRWVPITFSQEHYVSAI